MAGPERAESEIPYQVVLAALALAPPTVATLFPEGVTESRNLTFITVFFLTLPWSLAVTLTVFLAERNLLGSGWVPFIAIAAIIVTAGVIGNGIAPDSERYGIVAALSGSAVSTSVSPTDPYGTGFDDPEKVAVRGEISREFFQAGHPAAKAAVFIFLALVTYADLYGWALFLAGAVVGGVAAYKLDQVVPKAPAA